MQVEPDPTKLKALYDSMDTMLLDAAFNLCICQAPQGWVLQKSVKGFTYDTFNFIQLGDVWLDK